MLNLVWTDEALEDLDAIADYIGARNSDAAKQLLDKIRTAAAQLTHFPHMYRIGLVPGTREAVVTPNYRMIYLVGRSEIVILAIIHSRRQYP